MTEILNLDDLKRRMEGALNAFSQDLAGLRTGRASANMIDQITVDAYGSKMPIEQVGTISIPEPRTISIQVWDKGLVISVEKSIQESGLGLNPQTDGQLVRIPVPELNEERRQELIKIAGKYSEQSRVSIRNIRRDGMDIIKAMEKNSEIGKDESVSLSSNVQDLTDDYIVVNKKSGIVTHIAPGNYSGTLQNGLYYEYPELSKVPRTCLLYTSDAADE